MTEVIIAAGWSIATRDGLSIDFSGNRNVLANGETKDVGWVRQGKPVAMRAHRSLVNSTQQVVERTWRYWGIPLLSL